MLKESKRRVDESTRIRELLEMCVRQIDPEHGNGFDAILERYQERRAIIEERRQQKAEA